MFRDLFKNWSKLACKCTSTYKKKLLNFDTNALPWGNIKIWKPNDKRESFIQWHDTANLRKPFT